VSIADDVLSVLPNLQAEAESLMIDQCTVSRMTGEQVTDPITGVVTDEAVEVYAGKCKIQSRTAMANEPTAGGHKFTIEQLAVHFPITTVFELDDVVTVTAAQLDPNLIGLKLRLSESPRGTIRTANRWNAELITG